MALTAKFGNWIAETTATTGTGNITLSGALAANYATFSDVASEGDQIYYHIFDRGSGDQEAGIAAVLAGGLLQRTPQATLVSSVYDNTTPAAITLSGDAVVYGSATADTIALLSSEVAARLPKDGSEPMTGELTLSGDATSDLGAVPLQQLNAEIYTTGRKNYVDNGGFTVWQRGNGPFASNIFHADRWRSIYSSLIANRVTAACVTGNALKITASSSTQIYSGVHCIELIKRDVYTQFRNRTFTLSFKCLCTEAANFYVFLGYSDDSAGTNLVTVFSDTSVPIPSTSGLQQYSATFTVSAEAVLTNVCLLTHIGAQLASASSTAEVYITEVQLEEGSKQTKFEVVHPADQLDRCLRYYQASEGTTRYNYEGTIAYPALFFPQKMRVTPSLYLYGDVNDANATTLSVSLPDSSKFQFYHPTISPGSGKFIDLSIWTADAEF